MQTFITYFNFELKRFFNMRNNILVALILILSLGFAQSSINDYKSTLKDKDEFQEVEKFKISQFFNYRVYGAYGCRLLFLPAPFSVLFTNTSIVPEMTAFIDSGERLNINNPLIGKNIFGIRKFGFSDFSGILLFFGSLLALFYGYETLYYKEHLKSLSSLTRPIPLFFSLIISRLLIIILLLFAIVGGAFLLFILNGLSVPLDGNLAGFMLSIILSAVFFFFIGTAVGTVSAKLTAIPILLSIWFIFVFVIPASINSYIDSKSSFIKPVYKMEIEKIKIVMDFEKKIMQKGLSYKYGEKLKEPLKLEILGYWNNEFKKMTLLEKEMYLLMRKNMDSLECLSVLFPTTHYLSVANEVSSRGYENLLDFYDYTREQKVKFFKNYIDKVYFSNYSKVESFTKGDENVYYARSRLPGTFVYGIGLTLGYILLVGTLTYVRYRKTFFYTFRTLTSDGTGREHPDLKFSRGQFRVFNVENKEFLNRLYSRLSSQNRTAGTAGLMKQNQPDFHCLMDAIDNKGQKNSALFFYLCSPESLPGDINVRNYFQLMARLSGYPRSEAYSLFERIASSGSSTPSRLKSKRLSQLKKSEKAEFLLALTWMVDASVFLVHDVARGMSRTFTVQFKDRMNQLAESGKLVLYLTGDTIISENVCEGDTGFIESTTNWIGMVESVRQ